MFSSIKNKTISTIKNNYSKHNVKVRKGEKKELTVRLVIGVIVTI